MINPVSIGKRITIEREKLGLSQQDLSALVFVTPQAISKWERGLSVPSIEAMARLIKLFSISVDELLFDDVDNDLSKMLLEHSREYVLERIMSGRIKFDLEESMHLFSGPERLRLLKWILANGNYNIRKCWHLFSMQERIYLYKRLSDEARGSLYLSNRESKILKKEKSYEL